MPKEIEIPGTGKHLIVDDELATAAAAIVRAIWMDARGYPHLRMGIGRLFYCMYHRQDPGKGVVDHKDRNPLNNTRDNLRLCTPSQNMRNRRFDGSASGFKGVWRNGKRWSANISVNNRHVFLGNYATREEAARAFDAAARFVADGFAVTNFPGTDALSIEEIRRLAKMKPGPRGEGARRRVGRGYDQRDGRFRARIRVNGQKIELGTYATAAEASAAYQKAKAKVLACLESPAETSLTVDRFLAKSPLEMPSTAVA